MSRKGLTRSIGVACAVAFLAVAVVASAKGRVHVSRAPGPPPTAGRAWSVKLLVRPASFTSVVRLVATGPRRLTVRARGGRGVYHARLVFPETGAWKLAAIAGGSRSGLGSVRVRAAPPIVFVQPSGVDVARDGSLLVVESGRLRLVRVRPATGQVTPIAFFDEPWGVAQAPSGSIFVSDRGSLRRVDGKQQTTTVATVDPGLEIGPVTVAPGGDVYFTTAYALYRLPQGQAGPPQRLATGTAFSSPHGLAVAADGAVLVSDTDNGRILRVDTGSGAVTTFAELAHPRGIDVASDGSVYVVAADEHRVVHLSATGTRLSVVGPTFQDPYALAVAADGSVYVDDIGSGLIRRIG